MLLEASVLKEVRILFMRYLHNSNMMLQPWPKYMRQTLVLV